MLSGLCAYGYVFAGVVLLAKMNFYPKIIVVLSGFFFGRLELCVLKLWLIEAYFGVAIIFCYV